MSEEWTEREANLCRVLNQLRTEMPEAMILDVLKRARDALTPPVEE